MNSRPWQAPGHYWPEQPDVMAGQDLTSGGTWQGINGQGVVATVLNRAGTLGPQEGMRSRGELPLLALKYGNACRAAEALSSIDTSLYRPFNMLVADAKTAFWIANKGGCCMLVQAVPEGLSMLTAHDLNDVRSSPRMAKNLPKFQQAPAPNPVIGDWQAWGDILAFPGALAPNPERFNIRPDAMTITSTIGFETLSSSYIAVPADRHKKPCWRFVSRDGIVDLQL